MEVEHARRRVPELESICRVRATAAMLADLAACYFTLDDPERALPLLEKAYSKSRQGAIAMNLGLVLKDLGRHEEATKIVQEAFFANPDDFYCRLGYSEGLLKAGLWKQAWPLYDNSRPTQAGAAMDLRLPASVREWHGEPLPEGHELLVINEGGSGDRINYARFLPELTKKDINWKFYPYESLFEFFTPIFPRERLVADADTINASHWCTTFSLPAKLKITPTQIPPPLPIKASDIALTKYKMSVPDGRPIVGICYSAAEAFQGGRKVRSMTEGQAMRLVCLTADCVHWVNVQHGTPMPYPVTNVSFVSWMDTAGLISNLDALVSVDTGTMHLGGAIGKPMAVVLSGNSCWKFGKKGKEFKWYPTAKYYHNARRGVEDAVSELIQDIRTGVWPPWSSPPSPPSET